MIDLLGKPAERDILRAGSDTAYRGGVSVKPLPGLSPGRPRLGYGPDPEDIAFLKQAAQSGRLTDEQSKRVISMLEAMGAAPRLERPDTGPLPIPTPSQLEVAGGILGAVGSPFLGVPSPAGAGMGALALRSLGDLARMSRGEEPPDPHELAMSGVRPMIAEFAGQKLFGAAGRGAQVLGISQRLSGVGKAMARKMQDLGRRFGVDLTAGDIHQTKTLKALENLPSFFAFGAGIVQRFREGQLGQANAAAWKVAERQFARRISTEEAGQIARRGIRGSVQNFRKQAREMLARLDSLAGDEPVDITRLKSLAKEMVQAGRSTPLGAPRGAQRIAGIGAKKQEEVAIGGVATPIEDLAPSLRALLDLPPEQMTAPFRLVRQIEADLGQMAFSGKPHAIGTVQQGRAGALYAALRDDLDDFLTLDEVGQQVAPELADFRRFYKEGKRLYNESVVDVLYRTRPDLARDLPGKVFQPGAHENILDFHTAVGGDVYRQTLAAWYQDLIVKHTGMRAGAATFNAASFARDLNRFVKTGTVDVMFEPKLAADVTAMTELFSGLATAENIAGLSTGQALLSTGQVMAVVRMILTGIASGGGALVGAAPGAVALGTTGPAVGATLFSKTGRKLFTEGLNLPRRGVTAASGRLGRRLLSQGTAQLFFGDREKRLPMEGQEFQVQMNP